MLTQIKKGLARNRFHLGLGLIVASQVAGIVGYFYFNQAWWLWSGLAVTLLTVLGLSRWVKRTLILPLNDLSKVGHGLAQDCANLSAALSELARGNLNVRVPVPSFPVDGPAPQHAEPLTDALNTGLANLRSAALEFNELTYDPLQRLCYVGTDYYLDGCLCGETLGRLLGGQGQIVLMMVSFELDPLDLRCKGAESVLAEKYPGIQIMEVVETSFDPEEAYGYTRELLKRYPHLTGIYVSDGVVPTGVARAVVEAGAVGRVKIVCHDAVEGTMRQLQQGVITATVSQDLYAQGHDSVIHLFNHLVTGWRPSQPRLLTPLQLITGHNYNQYWQSNGSTGEIAERWERLAQPLERSSRRLRIAVHNRNLSEVDQQLHAGALAATAKLRAFNVNVDLISGGALRVKPIVESVVAQQYDGLVVLAANKKDADHLNWASRAGVTIATYNAEPFSLRGLVNSLTERVELLLGFNRDLAKLASPTGCEVPNCGFDQRPEPDEEQLRQRQLIQQAVTFMQENLEEAISVADVAQAVYLSPSYFCRVFTEQTGHNPSDFLMELRLERAKAYLAQTDMSVTDVSVALGYNPSYFSRLFKSRVGCTPGQYASRNVA